MVITSNFDNLGSIPSSLTGIVVQVVEHQIVDLKVKCASHFYTTKYSFISVGRLPDLDSGGRRFKSYKLYMYNITKFEYKDFTLYSVSRKDEDIMTFSELWKVKQQITDLWCSMYFPPIKDYVDNANEYHLFSCKEPEIHLGKNFEESNPINIKPFSLTLEQFRCRTNKNQRIL